MEGSSGWRPLSSGGPCTDNPLTLPPGKSKGCAILGESSNFEMATFSIASEPRELLRGFNEVTAVVAAVRLAN